MGAAGFVAGLFLTLANVPVSDVGAASPAFRPSIQYVVAHSPRRRPDPARRPEPGSAWRSSPRTADRWAVDGEDPLTLPAGRLTGKSILGAAPTDAQPTPDAPAGPDQTEAPTLLPGPHRRTDRILGRHVHTPGGSREPGRTGVEVFGFLLTGSWPTRRPRSRLGEALDHSPTSGRAPPPTVTSSGRRRRVHPSVGWSGWTSSNLTSVIDAAHANGARRPDHSELCLDLEREPGRREAPARELDRTRQPRSPDRGRCARSSAPIGVNLDPRADRSDLRRRIHLAVQSIRTEPRDRPPATS